MRVTIAGDLGSGKSVVSKRLSEKLNYKLLSTGNLFREIAKEKGMDVLQLTELAKTDNSIDKFIDNKLINLKEDNYIIDSRMAWHFVKDSLKIYLSVDINTAAERIIHANRSSEKYSSIQEAVKSVKHRREEETCRYKTKYDVDINDYNNYDIILNTSNINVDEVVNYLYGKITELK